MKSQSDTPFVGIRAYTITEKDLFFARDQEIALVRGMVFAHRVVLLYGDSGNGKSSLINAGLVPSLQISAPDFQPERLRLSRDLQTFQADFKPISGAGPAQFQSLLGSEHTPPNAPVSDAFPIPAGSLGDRLLNVLGASGQDAHASPSKRVLLIFDQFEELHSFAGGRAPFSIDASKPAPHGQTEFDAIAQQRRLASEISRLLTDEQLAALPVKFLFVFREEYLAKLLALVPELNEGHRFRLAPLDPRDFPRIVQGPFTPPAAFAKDPAASFFVEAATRIGEAFRRRSAGVGQNILTEIQVFCSELWGRKEFRAALPANGDRLTLEIDRTLHGYFQRVIAELRSRKSLTIALLCEMVTLDKTRNVVSEASLLEKFSPQSASTPAGSPPPTETDIADTLRSLEKNRLINLSERNGARFYDLASESLIPWLSEQRRKQVESIEQQRQGETERQRHRKQWLWAAGLAAASCIALAMWALVEQEKAKRQKIAAEEQTELAELRESEARVSAAKALRAQEIAEAATKLHRSEVEATQKALQNLKEELREKGFTPEQIKETTDKFGNPLVARLSAHTDAVTVAAFSPDGKWIATGSADKMVRLWSMAGELSGVSVASESKGGVSALTFTRNSQLLLTGSSGQSVRVFDCQGKSLREVYANENLADTVTWLEFSPDGKLAVCASGSGTTKLLQWEEPQSLPASKRLTESVATVVATWTHTPRQMVTTARFSSDGKRVVTSCEDGKVRVFGTEKPYALVPDDLVSNPLNVKAPTRGFRFSPVDASLVVGGAGLRKLVWWKVASGQISLWRDSAAAGTHFHNGAVLNVAFQPAGKYFVSVATDGLCIVWEASTAKSVAQVPTEIGGRLFNCDWNGDFLALVGEDGWMEIWSMADPLKPAQIFSTQAHTGFASGVRFSPDGDLILTWSDIPTDYVPSAKDKAAEFDRDNGPTKSDNSAGLWDLKWCQQKGWSPHPPAKSIPTPNPKSTTSINAPDHYLVLIPKTNPPIAVYPHDAEGSPNVELFVLDYNQAKRAGLAVGHIKYEDIRARAKAPILLKQQTVSNGGEFMVKHGPKTYRIGISWVERLQRDYGILRVVEE